MERIKPLDKLWALDYPAIQYVLGIGKDYKIKNHSGQPTGLTGANYLKLGNKEIDIVGFVKHDKMFGYMQLIYLVDYKQEICFTFVPPPKLTRAQIEYTIGYAKTDKEAMNKAREFRTAIKNGLGFYRYRREQDGRKKD